MIVTVQLPPDLPPGSLNCADGVCIPINTTPPVPPASPPLTPAKAQVEPSCQPGGECTFNITLTNNTGQVWSGVPNVTDDMPAGASATAASPPWNCSPNGSQVYCEHPQVTLNPGETLTLSISTQLPQNLPPGSLNCANGACIPVNVTPPQPPQPPPPPTPTDPTPPRTAACEDQVRAGGDAPETIDVPITNRSGTATFRFDTYNKKDRILVYVDGALTYDSTCVGTNGNKETQFSVPPGSQNVRVEVQPNCEAGTGTGTQWQFQLICPPTQQPPVRQSLPPRPPRVSLPAAAVSDSNPLAATGLRGASHLC